MGGWSGEGKDTIIWDGTIKADIIKPSKPLSVSNGGTGVTTRTLYSNLMGVNSVNYDEGFLVNDNNIHTIDWELMETKDQNNTLAITWGYLSRRLYDDSGNESVDFGGNRILKDGSGNTSLNWDTRTLYNNAGAVFNWNDGFFLSPTDGLVSLDFASRTLYGNAENVMVDWLNGILYDSSSVQTFDWNTLTASIPVILMGYTVATLPAGTVGMSAYVTDALAPAWNAAVVGGGAVVVKVFYNGAAWVCG